MGCGCSKKRVQFKKLGGVKAQHIQFNRGKTKRAKELAALNKRTLREKCPRCTWPMTPISRYDMKTKKQVKIRVCTNRSCGYRKNA